MGVGGRASPCAMRSDEWEACLDRPLPPRSRFDRLKALSKSKGFFGIIFSDSGHRPCYGFTIYGCTILLWLRHFFQLWLAVSSAD